MTGTGTVCHQRRHLETLPVLTVCGNCHSERTKLLTSLAAGLQQDRNSPLRVGIVAPNTGDKGDEWVGQGKQEYGLGVDWLQPEPPVDISGGDSNLLAAYLTRLSGDYDLVLVNGGSIVPGTQLILLEDGEGEQPQKQHPVVLRLHPGHVDMKDVLDSVYQWLVHQWMQTPVWGCVLIGGKSRRMGRPKHLLEQNGITWIERIVETLQQKVQQVVISGPGALPESLSHLPRIADAPGLAGPLAGILGALRRKPQFSWLVSACDLPDIHSGALEWLLAQREPGVWATLPDLDGDGRVEPLLAYYNYRCRHHLEAFAATGSLRISGLVGKYGVKTPQPPAYLQQAWRNVNTPEDI